MHGDPLSPDPDRRPRATKPSSAGPASSRSARRDAADAAGGTARRRARRPDAVLGGHAVPAVQPRGVEWQWEERLLPLLAREGRSPSAHGCRLCFEMSPSDMVFNPATLLRLRDEIGSRHRLQLRSLAPVLAADRPARGDPVLGEAIYHVHAKDTREPSERSGSTACSTQSHTASSPTRSWLFRTVGYGHGELVLVRLRLGAADGRVRRRRLDRARGRPDRSGRGAREGNRLPARHPDRAAGECPLVGVDGTGAGADELMAGRR